MSGLRRREGRQESGSGATVGPCGIFFPRGPLVSLEHTSARARGTGWIAFRPPGAPWRPVLAALRASFVGEPKPVSPKRASRALWAAEPILICTAGDASLERRAPRSAEGGPPFRPLRRPLRTESARFAAWVEHTRCDMRMHAGVSHVCLTTDPGRARVNHRVSRTGLPTPPEVVGQPGSSVRGETRTYPALSLPK